MTKRFDQRSSYRTLKAHENMIAFADFQIPFENEVPAEGVVKISSADRAFGGTQLTLTFIVDTAEKDSLKSYLDQSFQLLSSAHLKPYFGKSLERLVKVSLDSLADIRNWYIEEVGIHLRTAHERETVIVQELLLPALDGALNFKFGPVEWWPQGRKHTQLSVKEIQTRSSPKSLFQRWFGIG